MNNLFEKPTFVSENTDRPNYGKFTISKLTRGFATTLGNTLRRTTISLLEAAAPVAVKIEGVKHEFQTIPGVEEDVVNIILNLKDLVIKYEGNEPITITLETSQEGPVKASSFKIPTNAEIVSKDLVIANLETSASLVMEVVVAKGRGYKNAQDNKHYATKVGFIAMDANFSPVESANFEVKQINTTKSQSQEAAIFEIQTNGAISAKEAVEQAADILMSHFMLLRDIKDLEDFTQLITTQDQNSSDLQKVYDMTIEELNLNVRSLNALKRRGYDRVGDIAVLSRAQLDSIAGLGVASVEDVLSKLTKLGIEIK